ncbi:hypothetical protein ABZZ74_37055 [Streptomyces sp. NPDC006476]|jgi:hypothetical protein|uniref:hypothetical protein n=1 Tax=unclassified Streptomyces TaxID=2593676 RepID=UPI00339F9869
MTITDEVDRIPGDIGRALARTAVDRMLRPVWYALVAYGGMWLGGVDFDQDGTPVPRLALVHDAPEPAREDLRAS